MLRDLANNVKVHAGDEGDSIDLRGFDAVIITSTADLDGDIEVSDEADSGFDDVDSDDLIVPEGGAEQEGAYVLGYKGAKRYLKVTGDDAGQAVVIGYRLHRAPPGFEVDSED